MGWLLKTGLAIFGGKASTIFGLIMLVSLSTLAYNWKQSYDAKIVAANEAVHAQAELEREQQARTIYQNEVSKMMDNREKDEKAIKALQQYSETQQAVLNESFKQLQTAGGDAWANTHPPSNRQRVLAITLEEIEAASDIPAECKGTPTGCIIERMRNSIYQRPEGTPVTGEGNR